MLERKSAISPHMSIDPGQYMGNTDRVDSQINVWTQNLVPSKDGVNETARALQSRDTAERVYKGGVVRKVCLDSLCLLRRRALSEEADHAFDVSD